MTEISPEILRKLLRYDPTTGKLYWRERPGELFPHEGAMKSWNTRYAGTEAFTAINTSGYRHGKVFYGLYQAHRVIWALVYGEWPPEQIDHINGTRDDNRIDNLRAVSNAENQKNCRMRKDNTSGSVGVDWHKKTRTWQARIKLDGKCKYLGIFKNKADAVAARAAAELECGYHPNHGRKGDS